MYAGAMLLAWSGVMVSAQKAVGTEDLDKIMKKAGPASQAAGKAVATGTAGYAEVRTQLAIMKQAMVDSQPFWVEHKREDALKFNKDTIAKIDEVDGVMASGPADPAAAAAAVKSVGQTCRSCHQVYRATDADNNFILKPGSLGG
jgi:cytochrome c556